MKSIFVFFQIMMLCFSGFSQRNWSWYNPFPDGYHLNDIVFTSATNGWAVGDAGKLMHYDGQKWLVSEKYTNGGLRGLFFLDENHGWAVGGNRVILKYTDGLWNVENPESALNLNDVFFTSENNGWAVGDVRMHYTGNQWITIDTIGYSGITDVFFTDENNGWAGGSQKFYHYDTLGWHWFSLGFSDYYSVNSISFLDSAQGWIGGQYGDDYKYIQKYNGTNWSMSGSPPIISNDLCFNTPSHGWSCGDIGYMQMTDSTIWEYVDGHWVGSYISYGTPNSLSVLDSSALYVTTEYGHILYHDSLGWNLSNSLAEGKTELSFPDTSHGWAVGEGKNILHYTHGSWTIDTSFNTTRFEHIHFSDSVHGIASGRLADTSGLYAIYQYSDGQWHFITDTIHIAVKSVFCLSDGNAWLSGTRAYGSNMIKLINNILTCSSLADYSKVISLSFTDQENGWAIGLTSGLESNILHYQNGQWTVEMTTPFYKPITALSFAGPNSGWAIGTNFDNGITWHYNGEHWLPGPETTAELVAVHHPDSDHAYTIGYHDVYTLVNDHWEKETITVNQPLISVCFPSPETGWIAGEHGGILGAKSVFPVEIKENANPVSLWKLGAFPNPASDLLRLTVEGPELTSVEVEIYNLFIDKVFANEIIEGKLEQEINISDWANGLYLVRLLHNKEEVAIKKLIIY